MDDFAIYTSSAHLPSAERRLQIAVNRLHQWTTQRGFKFSPVKSVAMHFTKLRGVFPKPEINMGDNKLQAVDKVKFIGMTLDPKLSWIPHLKLLKQKCMKTIGILKTLSRMSWGADRLSLLRIYRALVRSRLDYGCQIYASAPKSTLQMLDPIHHLGIRLSIGAFRTSPVNSLYAESGEPSLYTRRQKLSLQLYARLLGMPNTPANIAITATENDALFARPRVHTTLGYRMRDLRLAMEMQLPNIMPTVRYHEPPWNLPAALLCEGIQNYSKSSTPAHVMKSIFLHHLEEAHETDVHIYTDGSKNPDGASYASVLPNGKYGNKLPPSTSIYSAELFAILTSLARIATLNRPRYVIFCDSINAIKSVCDKFSKHPIVHDIHIWIRIIARNNKQVHFCWVPGHPWLPVVWRESSDL